MRYNKFQEIITTAINKLKPTLTTEQTTSFQSQLTQLPKKIKQFNAQPYLFIFDLMLTKRQLIQSTLQYISIMLQQNYIIYDMYDKIAQMLTPLIKDYSYNVVQVILKVKEPHLKIMRLYFQICSVVALPEDVFRRYKSVGYGWLNRAFILKYRPLDLFQASIYNKFYPQQLPKLITIQQQQQQYLKYINLTLKQMVSDVQFNIQQSSGLKQKKGKYGFCLICNNTAEYYCKDTKVSVCNVECKKKHLEMLNFTIQLNSQYSQIFKQQLQIILLDNLQQKRSPALSIDFLIAIYVYSNFKPKAILPHQKILYLPVIFQRIWMLYLSYYHKKQQFFQHIFAYCLKVQSQYVRIMSSSYFLILANQKRFFEVYYAFDRVGDFRLTDFVLRSLQPNKQKQFIKNLTRNIYQNHHQNTKIYQTIQSSHLRIFNHQKSLTGQNLSQYFNHTNPQQKLIQLIIRNQLSINKDKLGQFLYNNENILKYFLKIISQKKDKAPIDELLRQIFYFINVKISDKIYRLIQLLAMVYDIRPPFDQNTFFTYCYFVIMIVTEFNSTHLNQPKPTIQSVVTRVEHFSPTLAKAYRTDIQAMYSRISNYSFSLQSRGILTYYQPYHYHQMHDVSFNYEEILIDNHELFYEIIITYMPEVDILHKLCVLAINHPVICQPFLQLLVDKLTDDTRDEFLVPAICNIIQRQPNAAGYLWREILQQRFSSFHTQQSQHSLNMNSIVRSTSLLTDSNFRQFTRQFTNLFHITDHIALYIDFIKINIKRLNLITQLLLINYQKCPNYYLKYLLIKKLSYIFNLSEKKQQNLQKMILSMLKSIKISILNQTLFIQCIISLNNQRLKEISQFWLILTNKCLEIKNQKNIMVLEGYIKQYARKYYQQYLIKKTLNINNQNHISFQMLDHLQKLEPFLGDIHQNVLKMFVVEDNIGSILRHFEYFYKFDSTYQLLAHYISASSHVSQNCKLKEEEDKIKNDVILTIQVQSSILKHINKLIQTNDKNIIIELDHMIKILIHFLKTSISQNNQEQQENITQITTTIIQYLKVFLLPNRQDRQQDKINDDEIKIIIKEHIHLNIFIEEILIYVIEVEAIVKQQNYGNNRDYSRYRKLFEDLHDSMTALYIKLRKFSDNIELRMKIHKYLKSNQVDSSFPSSLKHELSLLKCIFLMQDIRRYHNQTSFMLLLSQAQKVIYKQQQLSLSCFKPSYNPKEPITKLKLQQANKDALAYSEFVIDITDSYLKYGGELNVSDRTKLKGILINILIHGWYKEDSNMFHSLGSSSLSLKISQLLNLIK